MVSSEQREGWRDYAAKILKDNGISSYNPAAAFTVDLTDIASASAVVQINEMALLKCSYVLFNMSSTQPSIGTPIELYIAAKCDKPRIVVWDNKEDPLPAYLAHYAGTVVFSLDEALAAMIGHDPVPLAAVLPDDQVGPAE